MKKGVDALLVELGRKPQFVSVREAEGVGILSDRAEDSQAISK